MKVIKNNIIPFKGFLALTVWPFIFVRKDCADKFGDVALNHENIHGRQQVEVLLTSAVVIAIIILLSGISWWWMLLSLGVYYTWYCLEYVIRDVLYGSTKLGYRNICFEQEAYIHEGYMGYLSQRHLFAWVKYLWKRTF